MNISIIKNKIKSTINGALLAFLIVSIFVGSLPAALAQGTVIGGKTLSITDIQCDGSTQITLTLDAKTGIAGEPEDIMLVLDRSGSMTGKPLADLKVAANTFVDVIDEATDGVLDGTIAYGSRIGVVSFDGGPATVDVLLTSNANDVKAAINALAAGGLTNHVSAINTAQAQLAGSEPTHSKDMILFTDGETTEGGNGQAEADAARAAGTVIFAIGLGSVNTGQLNGWATDPDATHVFITPDSGDLQTIFQTIGAAIVVPAATNVQVVDTVSNHFSVSGVSASKGSVAQVGNVLTWTINKLGTEVVTLVYTATHDNTKAGGSELVNDLVTYTDDAGLTVTFPNPAVKVGGCAAKIELTPVADTNELGTPGQTHTVTAKVTDDFNNPVNDVTVNFEVIAGPNAGKSGSGTTNVNGEATFTYTAEQGLAGLGTDTIRATVPLQAKVSTELTANATKEWKDTTPPECNCMETVNPGGKNVPQAPGKGQNEDGFYMLTATDLVDPNPQIFVRDTGSGSVFGPFVSGTNIKYTQDPDAAPEQKDIGGPNSAVSVHIIGTGDAAVFAKDSSGNTAQDVPCLVPPPPK